MLKRLALQLLGDINGNAATATTLATARNIAGNAFDGSGNITIAAADLSDVTDAGSGAIITDSERTKLTNIETSADVTDATNVLAAGAVMTTGDQTLLVLKRLALQLLVILMEMHLRQLHLQLQEILLETLLMVLEI